METNDISKNLKSKFANLIFEPNKHTYSVDGVYLPSASKIAAKYYKKFDADIIAPAVARRDNKSTAQVKNEWIENRDEASRHGKSVHNFGEAALTKINLKDLEKIISMCKFFAEFNITKCNIIAIEQPIYSKKYKFAGTPDVIVEKDGKSYMIDWKTNGDLLKSYDNLYPPFDKYPANNLHKYYIQQNLYKLCLREHGYEIDHMLIVHLLNDNHYQIYEVPDWQELMHTALSGNIQENIWSTFN